MEATVSLKTKALEDSEVRLWNTSSVHTVAPEPDNDTGLNLVGSPLPSRAPNTFNIPQGRWRPVILRLSCDATSNTSYTQCKLIVSCSDTAQLLHTIYINPLFQTDIRRAHRSLFFRDHVIGIHCRAGPNFGIPIHLSNSNTSDKSSNLSVAGFQSTSSSGLLSSSSETPFLTYPVTSARPFSAGLNIYAPTYLAFSAAPAFNAWFSLFQSYARPEIFVNGVPAIPSHEEKSGQHRKWRSIGLEIHEARGPLGPVSGGVFDFPTGRGVEEGNPSKDSVPLSVDSDIFCEILLDGLQIGRTTTKRIPRGSSSSQSSGSWDTTALAESFVMWRESFEWAELPTLGKLQIVAWKAKAEKERPPPLPGASSVEHQRQRLTSFVSSSLSGSVALLSSAAGFTPKDREPICIGQVEIALSDFRRGELVEGWWALGPLSTKAPWTSGKPSELKLKMRVDEYVIISSLFSESGSPNRRCTILPLSNYSELSSVLQAPDSISFFSPSTADGPTLSAFLPQWHVNQLVKHRHDLSLATSTLIPQLTAALSTEISNYSAKAAAKSSSSSPNTLFRGNSALTKTAEYSMQRLGQDWLMASVGYVVREIIAERVVLDYSDVFKSERKARTGEGSTHAGPDVNAELQAIWCEKMWTSIWNARDDCPQ